MALFKIYFLKCCTVRNMCNYFKMSKSNGSNVYIKIRRFFKMHSLLNYLLSFEGRPWLDFFQRRAALAWFISNTLEGRLLLLFTSLCISTVESKVLKALIIDSYQVVLVCQSPPFDGWGLPPPSTKTLSVMDGCLLGLTGLVLIAK